MSGLPQPLVGSFRWAHESTQWLNANAKSRFFFETDSIPTSSWFSGFGCSEKSLEFLNVARKAAGATEDAFIPVYQFEINAKCRNFCAASLPASVCQHIDILRMLKNPDREKVLKLIQEGAEGKETEEKIWNYLLGISLENGGLCSRHLQRLG